ncbi:MAG: hypothetical protein ACYTEP_04840 [Planctomycetota bacterium]|jgi:hypothetical protein
MVEKERPKFKAPPPPREFNPRQSFSTRQLPGGSPVFDKVFPCAVGFAIGCAVGTLIVQGNPDRVKFSTGGFDHPLFIGAILGFCIGTLLSPIALWLTRGRTTGKGIMPVTIVLGLLLALGLGMVG